MNCGRCGGPIGNRVIRYNGVVLCENCARELGVDEAIRSQSTLFGQAFPMFEELTNTILGNDASVEFANTKIRCPRCKMTLREFEVGGQAGCIECFNTFNETILKSLLKRQGSSEYKGRKPGEISEIVFEEENEVPIEKEDTTSNEPAKVEKEVKEEPKPEVKKETNLDDLSSMSDEELTSAMKKAAADEDYKLAVKLRDELKKRKEGN